MKTNAKSLGVILFTLATAFFGCKKEDISPMPGVEYHSAKAVDVTVPAGSDENKTKAGFIDGFWEISAFYLDESQSMQTKSGGQTVRFKDWRFVFNGDGQVVALKNGERVMGKWSRGNMNMKDDVMLDFGSQFPFSLLNNTWQMQDRAQQWRFLEDKNTADGKSGYLVFKKLDK